MNNPDSRLLGVFDFRKDWVRELRDMKEVDTYKIDTKVNCADLFTKCHEACRHKELVELIKSKAGRHF